MSGTLSRGTCYVKGFSATRVAFFLGSTPLNTDGNVADGMSCILDTRAFPNGTRQLRAVAYDSTGRSYEERISINIQNAGSTPPNTAPTVSLTSPSAGETVTGTLNYAATAYDNAGVSRVEFRLNGGLIATDVTAPYAGTVTAPAAGTHTLTATAYDAAGLSNSSSVTFTVPPATPPINTAPTVSITSPQPGQSVAGTLNFAANATDNSGVARVEFRVDGALVGTDTSAPFTGSVAAPGPGTHTLTATAYDAAGLSATSSVTFSVGQASPVACSPGATSAINVTVQPSRISGIAPLYVFFDATGTTATRTARPFHELEYRWNFGDPASGAWSYGSGQGLSSNNSRNLATGPVAGHVFETAGTYNVCLTANDGTNTASRPVTITVTSPDAAPEFAGMATVCVDSRARPVAGADGCPAGAAVLLSADFDDVINTAARNGATHRRILFRRGSTFTTSTAARLHANGPGLVGAYGTGAKPYINGASAKMSLGSTSNLAFADWRVVDLNFDGQNQTATGGAAFQATGPFRQVTLLRVEARRVLHGVLLSKTFLDQINSTTPFRAPIFSELGIVDSTIEDVYDYGFLGHAHRVSFLGNRFHARTNPATPQNGAGHLIRLAYTNSAVVSHNELGGWAQGNSLTIRGLSNQGDRTIPPDAWTEKVVVSDNTINGGSSVWFFTIRRVNDQLEARFRNILVERNLLVATPPTVTMLATDGGEMTIRNNLLNLTGAATPIGIALGKSNLAPAGVNANVAVYNNTAYSGSSGSGNFRFVSISDAPPNLRVRNNLSYVPNLVGSHVATSGTPGPGAVISHNTDGAAIRSSNPGFASASGPAM
ncbi:MAG TPA: Ig-like domain-containing protein, partial [Vicinamibacterales bacterium]|nr:Ig-like domain-containing protein [Vicinamibacterales bacterium]